MNPFCRRCCAVLLLAAWTPAFSQVPHGPTPQQLEQEQRRAELRSALMKAQGSAGGSGGVPAVQGLRQLSPEERAQLREQLRQQQGGHR
ncbi:MAG TPA: hypothetical protein VGE70_09655 [Burkholderiaceae bacterium]